MKRIAILLSFIFAAILCSCGKTEESDTPLYKDPPASRYEMENLLGAYESSISQWQTDNKYSETLLCGKLWEFSKIYLETYVDGELSETSDYPFHSSSSQTYFFDENHSMRSSGDMGVWLYVNNHIIMRHSGSYYAYEIADLTQSTLILKREEAWFVSTTTPFDIDKSGKHAFIIREFQAQ